MSEAGKWRSCESADSSRSQESSKSVDSKKDYSEEEFFDSGIQSEYLSSEVISETDIKYGDSALDCDYDSKSLDQEDEAPKKHSRESVKELPKDYKEVDYKSLPTALDSGLDLDCEEELASSQVSELLKKSEVLKADPGPTPGSWDKFFEPDDEGNTQLHLAIIQGRQDRALLILSRIPESRYLDLQNHRRETSLHLSVLMDNSYMTRRLLLAGARTGVEDSNGNTPLHLACKMGYLLCVEALLNRSRLSLEVLNTVFMYNPRIDSPHTYINEWNYDGLTCMHLAAAHRDFNVLNQLFEHGCDVNKRECKGGYTILHAAVRSGRVDLVKFILQHKKLNKVNTEIQNYARLTAYQLSAYYPQIASILAENGAIKLSTVEDDSEDDSSDESDDESYESNGIESTSQIMNNLINSVIPTVITTAS